LQYVLESRKATFSATFGVPDPNNADEVARSKGSIEWVASILPQGEDPEEPFNDLHYPMIPESTRSLKADPDKNQTAVGVMALTFFWRELLKNIMVSLLLVSCFHDNKLSDNLKIYCKDNQIIWTCCCIL